MKQRFCGHCGQALNQADWKNNECPRCGDEVKQQPVKRDPRMKMPIGNKRVKTL